MIIFRSLIAKGSLLVALMPSAVTFAADWPPTLDLKNPATNSLDGRTIERYTHGPRDTWGYPVSTNRA